MAWLIFSGGPLYRHQYRRAVVSRIAAVVSPQTLNGRRPVTNREHGVRRRNALPYLPNPPAPVDVCRHPSPVRSVLHQTTRGKFTKRGAQTDGRRPGPRQAYFKELTPVAKP